MKDIKEIISELSNGTLRESESVEFKHSLPHDFPSLAKIIVSMANGEGGYLILGVDEFPKGIVINGVDKPDDVERTISAVFNEFTIGTKGTVYYETIDSKVVAIIQVDRAESIAYYSRRKTSPERLIAYQRIFEGKLRKLKQVSFDEKRYKVVYKYMTIDAFLVSLYAKTWRFFEPNKWNDKYEQRFYCANYQIPGAERVTPMLFATCVTREQNSEAAWKVYSHGQGLGSHCVQLELDIDKLRTELRNNGLAIAEKSVEYKAEKYILELHNKNKSKDYAKYFSNFTFEKFLELLTLKREAYSYEKEVRLFAIPRNNAKRSTGNVSRSKDLIIDWSKVIRKVRIDKACTDAELISIQQACFSAGINPVIAGYSFIGNIPKPKDCVNIEFDLFDIDAMPGNSRITIK